MQRSSIERARRALAEAKYARDGWHGLNGIAYDGGRVHEIELDEAGEPIPHCGVGLAGWDPSRVRPTLDPVSCELCRTRRIGAGGNDPAAMPGQDPLWLDSA